MGETKDNGKRSPLDYVGTLVGACTSTEFRIAVALETVREQDIIAVDAVLKSTDPEHPEPEQLRVWAKIKEIERINPLFPTEAGHELAETRTNPIDTILSFSREMVTAVCQVLGTEPSEGSAGGRLDHLRYPAQPASSAYRPTEEDLKRIILGKMADDKKAGSGLDLASLANRPSVGVRVDGHAVVTRHLAILAMTGAGKSWTARRLVEQLAEKNYPMVIFDPHGDYARLGEVDGLGEKVKRYSAEFPIFDEDADTVAEIIGGLGSGLSDAMQVLFGEIFKAAQKLADGTPQELRERSALLSQIVGREEIIRWGIRPNLYLVADLAEAATLLIDNEEKAAQQEELRELCWQELNNYRKGNIRTLDAIKWRTRKAAKVLRRMETTNHKLARAHEKLPTDRRELVRYGQISVVSLAGYTSDFQATIFSIVAEDIFEKRVSGDLKLQVLLLLEEAHNFAPANAYSEAEKRSISITKQVAQEGRKFGVGLIMISQRPSRLDGTTLSQCNSHIIMRMVNPADQNFVKRTIESISESEVRMLSGLDVGEAILAGQMINFPVLARIKPPESKGEREEEDAFASLEKAHSEARDDNQRRAARANALR